MSTNDGTAETMDGNAYRRVAEAAWAIQAQHERFLFKQRRPDNHPSRVPWVTANRLWYVEAQARKQGRVEPH